jgi:hypothetical protein
MVSRGGGCRGATRGTSMIAESACTEIITASEPPRVATCCAAHVRAAAVPAGRGSAMTFSAGIAGTAARTASTSDAFVRIIVRSGGAIAEIRSIVSASIDCDESRGSSCFGRSGVLIGQKREPIPPANTTTQVSPLTLSLRSIPRPARTVASG